MSFRRQHASRLDAGWRNPILIKIAGQQPSAMNTRSKSASEGIRAVPATHLQRRARHQQLVLEAPLDQLLRSVLQGGQGSER